VLVASGNRPFRGLKPAWRVVKDGASRTPVSARQFGQELQPPGTPQGAAAGGDGRSGSTDAGGKNVGPHRHPRLPPAARKGFQVCPKTRLLRFWLKSLEVSSKPCAPPKLTTTAPWRSGERLRRPRSTSGPRPRRSAGFSRREGPAPTIQRFDVICGQPAASNRARKLHEVGNAEKHSRARPARNSVGTAAGSRHRRAAAISPRLAVG